MAEEIEIYTVGGDKQGAYRADLPGSDARAELRWHRKKGAGKDEGDLVVASRTFTPPEMRGQGIAGRLVRALVDDAREQGFRIVPECSYVAHWFDRHPEEANLRA